MITFEPKTISEKLMFAVKRIRAYVGCGKIELGTGYAYSHLEPDGTRHLLIVTNKHVIKNANSIDILFHLKDRHLGEDIFANDKVYLEINSENSFVIMHPSDDVDLCVISVNKAYHDWSSAHHGKQLIWASVEINNLFDDIEIKELDACESVMMVGCPAGLWDEENGFPLFRRGFTATHPAVDFEGLSQFVVDIGVYSGSSGSPIFIFDSGLLRKNKVDNEFIPGWRFGLLGTLWGGPRITERGEIVVEPVPTSAGVAAMTGVRMHLGYVVKVRELRNLLAFFDKVVKDHRDSNLNANAQLPPISGG